MSGLRDPEDLFAFFFNFNLYIIYFKLVKCIFATGSKKFFFAGTVESLYINFETPLWKQFLVRISFFEGEINTFQCIWYLVETMNVKQTCKTKQSFLKKLNPGFFFSFLDVGWRANTYIAKRRIYRIFRKRMESYWIRSCVSCHWRFPLQGWRSNECGTIYIGNWFRFRKASDYIIKYINNAVIKILCNF